MHLVLLVHSIWHQAMRQSAKIRTKSWEIRTSQQDQL
jgi:hypothetical protein